jgi:N-acetylmuramoyl-L-alanine amidase
VISRSVARRTLFAATFLAILAGVVSGGTPALAGPRPFVVLDPGHGGTYPGAVNCHLHFAGQVCMRESDLNLDIALRTAKLLRGRGFHVVMTRNTDADANASHTDIATHNRKHDGSYVFKKDDVYDLKDELQARVNIANCGTVTACAPGDPQQADAFLSIHNNSCSCNARGTTTFHNGGAQLAQDVQREVVQRTGLRSRGVEKAGSYVIKWTRMPAALLEGAFMSDPHEAKLLHRASFRKRIAKGITAGIVAFLGQPAPGG